MTGPSRPVRIAVQIHPQHGDYAAIRDGVVAAEELGVDIVYNWDHFFPLYGDPDGKHFEAMTTLAAWAEQTSTIELGCLVTCNSYRNPDLLADMARTIDHISGGRFVLGMGSGWYERDYDEYGYEFGTAGQRLDALAESLPRIEARWQRLNPRPVRPIPVLVGGGGVRKTTRIAARHADIWHAGHAASPDELQPSIDALERWCVEAERDSAEIERAIGVDTSDPGRFLAEAAEHALRLGFTQFTLGSNGPVHDLAGVAEWLTWRDGVNAGLSPEARTPPSRDRTPSRADEARRIATSAVRRARRAAGTLKRRVTG